MPPFSKFRPTRWPWAVLALLQGGCSILSPAPTLELLKGVGGAVGTAVTVASPSARDTVHHLQGRIESICIQLEPDVLLADVVPALQLELREQGVSSRVYDGAGLGADCTVWLHYSTGIEWDVPPLASEHRPYLSRAQLVLRGADGRVLSSSGFEINALGMGKWASTRRKLAPVVKALVTGFEG
ncbi:hypothetical protein C7444_11861 [Sphaerotilus hippei]|uniref:Uncharacterized protein n=1 Tax=Sphaerotilus hippei TaxID=744406 RepID=A0A318GX33_9BURK|nr:cell division protein FtsI [Sphaerotilus hippei]PXW93692.1 hypothetical protein C7444_11861 [Sphaerotilus hippei]